MELFAKTRIFQKESFNETGKQKRAFDENVFTKVGRRNFQ